MYLAILWARLSGNENATYDGCDEGQWSKEDEGGGGHNYDDRGEFVQDGVHHIREKAGYIRYYILMSTLEKKKDLADLVKKNQD